MIRINQLKISVESENILENKIARTLKIKESEIKKITIAKRSIDARDKRDIKYVYTVDVTLNDESKINKKIFSNNITKHKEKKYIYPRPGEIKMKKRPVIVGMGPAGLFAGYFLASMGYGPIILERGECVDERLKTVNKFFNENILNKESNIQFGEGGAGTYSDGKLNTMVKDKDRRNRLVLETLVKFGAKEEILYVNKPHIGTDVLIKIVKNMRSEIKRLGGEILFNTKLTDITINNGILHDITVNEKDKIDCDQLILAIGHSARDTFELLSEKGLDMNKKAFAVGLRIEHKQSMINENMYGVSHHDILENADYKVTYNTEKGRGVYSFCMCPGGYVVNASSEEGRLAVNGMSYSKRDGENSNSAIIVTVTPEDYQGEGPLAGMEFQRRLEERAYAEGKGLVPVQLFGDFEKDRVSESFGEITPQIKGGYNFGNLRNIFPQFINETIIEGINNFNRNIKGFNRFDSVLSGVESRTSSPVRIIRNEEFISNIEGIYPCGEGAGYAGGITSAAMDGIRVFEAVVSKYSKID